MRALAWTYLVAAFSFIYLPVGALVLFSFQGSGLPVPPFDGPSLQWYRDIVSDDDVMQALRNSLAVAFGASGLATAFKFAGIGGRNWFTHVPLP